MTTYVPSSLWARKLVLGRHMWEYLVMHPDPKNHKFDKGGQLWLRTFYGGQLFRGFAIARSCCSISARRVQSMSSVVWHIKFTPRVQDEGVQRAAG